MKLLTHDGVLSNVTIDDPQLIASIKSEPDWDKIVYIEQFHPSRCDVWLYDSWILECKRRHELAEVSKQFRETYKPKVMALSAKQMLEKLMNEIK
jgi:hypothetical protein